MTHGVGSGPNDFWITYPAQLSKSGQDVEHPQWVINALETKPVIILAHSTNCQPCIIQQNDVETVLETFGDQVVYFDLLTDGSDERAWDAYNIYYSQDTSWYIPFTVIATKVKDTDGNSVIGWHSAVGATGEEWITGFIKDAINYHQGAE